MAGKRKKNPNLYRELSEPFENRDAAVAATEAFWEDLYMIREKHRMRDLYVVAAFSWKDGDDEGDSIVPMIVGDESKGPMMAAWAHGYESAKKEADLERVMKLAAKQAAR